MHQLPGRRSASLTALPFSFLLLSILLSAPVSVDAQPNTPYYYNGYTGWWWPGRIAAVAIAIFAIILIILAGTIALRRRRMSRAGMPSKMGQPSPISSWQQEPQGMPPPQAAAEAGGYGWYYQGQSPSQAQGSQVGLVPPPPYYPPSGPTPPPPAHTSR